MYNNYSYVIITLLDTIYIIYPGGKVLVLILSQYSPSPETKFRLTTDFGVMPVLNQ